MTQNNKPIATIGRYRLVYRSNDDNLKLEQYYNRPPWGFSLLNSLALIGTIRAISTLIITNTDNSIVDNPISIGFIAIAFMLPGFYASFGGAFLRAFALIDAKNPNPPPPPPTTDRYQWLLLGVLAVMFALRLYLERIMGLSATAPAFYLLSVFFIIIAVPYYGYRLYGIYRQLISQP